MVEEDLALPPVAAPADEQPPSPPEEPVVVVETPKVPIEPTADVQEQQQELPESELEQEQDIPEEKMEPVAAAIPNPESEPPPPVKIPLDTRAILIEQNHELAKQRVAVHSFIDPEKHPFAEKVDIFHDRVYRWMDNAVRRLDTWGASGAVPYTAELSTFRLEILNRIGGRGDDKKFDLKAKFKADLALPGLEKRLHLIFDNSGRDSLPGADPMKSEDDIRLGLSSAWDFIKDSKVEVGGGARWRSSGPVGYADIDWRFKFDVGGGVLNFKPRGFYYTDDGWGQSTTLTWRKELPHRRVIQLVASERSTEATHGVELEQSLYMAWLRSGHGRGWLFQASLFPHLKSSDLYMDDMIINLSWRDAFYRRWVYYRITPQIDFAREDDYEPRPSIRIGFDILFGGQIQDIL